MGSGLRTPRRSTPPSLLFGLLLSTLVLTGILGFQAHDAVVSHRETARRTLQDFAEFAGWEYRDYAQSVLKEGIWELFSPLGWTLLLPGEGPHPKILLKSFSASECNCYPLVSGRSVFRIDAASGEIVTAGEWIPEDLSQWISDTVRADAQAGYRMGSQIAATIVGGPPEDPRTVVYTVRVDEMGHQYYYGLEADAGLLPRLMAKVGCHVPLLPPSLTGGAPNDSLLSVSMATPGGKSVLVVGDDFPKDYTAVTWMAEQFGGVSIAVALKPAVAEALVIGGLPASRLPLILGLFSLTGAMILVAVRQIRRENELARQRADFATSVSHELRTPLAQIRMFLESVLLGRTTSDDERQQYLEIADEEAKRLSNLVDNVLHFSRAEKRTVRVNKQPLPLGKTLRAIVGAYAPLARRQNMIVRCAFDDEFVASVDADGLKVIVGNLLDNAVKYGPKGQTVTVGLDRLDGHAAIWVQDQGPGIPRADQRSIFEPFRRLERDTTSAVAGTGIGLALVREFTALHGGRYRVEDAVGGGARFVVELPIGAVAPEGSHEGDGRRAAVAGRGQA